MEYIRVNNVDEATHWIATNYSNYCSVTVGKAYELFDQGGEQGIFIYDNFGRGGLMWQESEGYLVRRED